MKKKKPLKIVLIILLILVLIALPFYLTWFGDMPWKGTVILYVKHHEAELRQLCDENIDPTMPRNEEKAMLREKLGWFTIVKSICDFSDGQKEKVEFWCGGGGFVGGSTSAGFYYSADDRPFGLEFDCYGLTETKEGCYEWHNDDRSHWIYTEHISENWYYYFMNWD